MTRDEALERLGGIAAWLSSIEMNATANEIRRIIIALEEPTIEEALGDECADSTQPPDRAFW